MDALLNLLISLDGRLLLLIQSMRIDALTPWVIRLTHLGDAGIIWIVITVILVLNKKTRRAGIVSALALVGSLCVTNLFLKNYVARIRPYEVLAGLECLLPKSKEFSFPSGHATAGFAAAMAIYKSRPKRLGVPLLILAFLISMSRLYVGIHYPSDVICGIIIGSLIGLVMFWIFGEREYKNKARQERRKRRKK